MTGATANGATANAGPDNQVDRAAADVSRPAAVPSRTNPLTRSGKPFSSATTSIAQRRLASLHAPMSQLSYDLINVFCLPGDEYSGNPLAVFYRAEQHAGLTQRQLQTIATRAFLKGPRG